MGMAYEKTFRRSVDLRNVFFCLRHRDLLQRGTQGIPGQGFTVDVLFYVRVQEFQHGSIGFTEDLTLKTVPCTVDYLKLSVFIYFLSLL